MRLISKLNWLVALFTIFVIVSSAGYEVPQKTKNILVLNSYDQGFSWTDSLMTGIVKEAGKNSGISLFIENLNSKQFGQSNFEATKLFFQSKYANVRFDGVLVTDNDALDFAFQYDRELFPNVPVVFAGISNPEDYPLEDSFYQGFKETSNTDSIIDLVRFLLPDAKSLLVLTDQTTTGKIYRDELPRQQARFNDFRILFPEVVDADSIISLVRSNAGFDAIFYIRIDQDQSGNPVDNNGLFEEVRKVARVAIFTNNPIHIGKGVVGGLFQSGKKQGEEAAKLLVNLMGAANHDTKKRVYTTEETYFFDHLMLGKFNIDEKKLPQGAILVNQKNALDKSDYGVLVGILILAGLIIVILSVVNRMRKTKQQRVDGQLREIETQKKELEETQRKLSEVISELQVANERLNDSNLNLLEAKKKAEESDNLKSAFLANVSHEIRTPLNSIVGFSSLLLESDLDEETRKTYVDLIESNTESLLVLIDEIIDLSKIEAQQITLKKQEFSIDGLMAELLQVFDQGHKNARVELRTSVFSKNQELMVTSDRVRVKQVFINLLTNALKFTDSGYIEMGYFLSGDREVVLYVRDTGIGISKEDHQAIFQRFRKLNENSGRLYRGTGLGLAITQKLVELLGGKIWIESELGEGSTFYFTFQGCFFKEPQS